MASSNEEQMQKIKKTSSMEQNKQPKSPNHNTFASKNNFIILAVAIIIALGALALATYTLLLNNQLQNQWTNTSTNLAEELKQLEQKQNKTQEITDAKTKNTEEIQTQFQTKFDALSKQLQNAMSQRFYQNQDWLFLKARYYLELAQINAHWSNSSDATVALLEQADQLLKQFNEPKIFAIRQAIAKDIAQIQAIPAVDIAGLLSQLDAAQNSINNLSIPLPENESKSTLDQSQTSSNNSSAWSTHLQESMNILGKLVVIRRHDQEVKPLLSPLLEAALKENLRLNLQEAQWAVLNHDTFVYQLVLKQAINTLKTNFNENTQNTTSLIKKLTELQQISITQKRPPVSLALPMLNELIESKKETAAPSTNNEQGGSQQ
ncbi:uroporphyrinogen III methylase HemX [Legionella sainthelensi]|uniref:uroporphyrinogen-III C-methyltransferase n=1 Tax=Legionella sainthelensi TaxID=28087 RepID=UPI000E2015CB|nr:uroporphyrinogen-III C-methyltransferase [Legionella sainthelensi]VEB33002.1 uroporphyrinogen III methylase HemX [Legionella sainthelensi]